MQLCSTVQMLSVYSVTVSRKTQSHSAALQEGTWQFDNRLQPQPTEDPTYKIPRMPSPLLGTFIKKSGELHWHHFRTHGPFAFLPPLPVCLQPSDSLWGLQIGMMESLLFLTFSIVDLQCSVNIVCTAKWPSLCIFSSSQYLLMESLHCKNQNTCLCKLNLHTP